MACTRILCKNCRHSTHPCSVALYAGIIAYGQIIKFSVSTTGSHKRCDQYNVFAVYGLFIYVVYTNTMYNAYNCYWLGTFHFTFRIFMYMHMYVLLCKLYVEMLVVFAYIHLLNDEILL